MDPSEPQGVPDRTGDSHAASAEAAADEDCAVGIADASAAAPEGCTLKADEGIPEEQECATDVPLVSEGKMDVEQDGTAAAASEAKMEDEEPPAAAPAGITLKVEETDEGIGNAAADVPLACEGSMDVEQGCTAAAPVASQAKMEVDQSSVPEQGNTAAGVASEVKVEKGEDGAVDQHPATPPVHQVKEEEECLVGRYISRSAAGHGRIQFGKVASYDRTIGMYSVVFDDGQTEDLGLPQLRELLITGENGASGMKFSVRKRKLDLLVPSAEVKEPPSTRQRVEAADSSQQTGSGSDVSEDAESSSNSSGSTKELPAELCPPVQGPELPPSSGDIALPEESISYLFSVYNFLRSFSVQLFLSPFGLEEFVDSINCTLQNTLLDAIHVSLLRALRRHLDTKSSEGSELASSCLKYLDWSLLDTLTWPTLLLEYLYVMGCMKILGGRSFGRSLLATEYYKLPVTLKLRVLQMLCDHAIDSEELKTELEAREGYNEEMEYETDSYSFSVAGSRAVLTRASKASACKNIEDPQNMAIAPEVANQEAVVAHAPQDGNSDDCRICGMDGTLVCCDGCPWAYHSRCIGLNKAALPQGLWFCPECVVNKLGPTSSRIERGARGAQMFGVDMCGRLFMGSCNYLLVFGTSLNEEPYARYYNQYDVVKVLQILALSDAYTDICRRLTEYWRHLLDIFQNERSNTGTPQSNTLSSVTPMKAGDGTVQATLSYGGYSVQREFVANQSTARSAEHLEEQKCMIGIGDAAAEKNNEVFMQTPLAQNSLHNAQINGAFGSTGLTSVSHYNGSVVTGVSNVTHAQPAHGLVRQDLSACRSGVNNAICREDIGSTVSVKPGSFCQSYQSKHPILLIAEKSGNMSGIKQARVSSFKPQTYINLYNHGNIAASAAANLAILTSDEGKVSASQQFTNPKKKMAADSALQLKAFSSAAAQFVWPSTDKKVMEVPRDRCGWCLACKSSASGNKKACFLNTATANAAKGTARILSSLQVIKSSENHLPSIVAYMANMEESLRGLLIGSLQDMQQKKRWLKQLHEASNCRTIIPLLLELESNIHGIAFSSGWSKLIDDWPAKSPGVSAGPSRSAAYQKRGTGGRRGRKRLCLWAFESATVTDDDKSWKEVNWWSGGNISKRILQRGALPISTILQAARQGGKKKMAGLSYHEGSNFPRRTRQFAWRACVGLSQNSSQLALQVRYLDAHIRWKEFVPPDQVPSDGRSSDADYAALRNAVVCGKKLVDNNIRYALKFPKQKHLPVRVTKNVLEAEGNQDENGKLWFSENHIPLYLVRKFEQTAGVSSLPSPGMLLSNCFTNFYQRRVRASISDVFSYLFYKGVVYPCSSCKKDVPHWDAVKCSSCQGNCHKECTSRSFGSKGVNAAQDLVCKLCLQKRNLVLTNYHTNASYVVGQQKSNGQQPVPVPKIIFKVGSSHSSGPAVNVEAQQDAKVEAQPVAKVKRQPIQKVEAWPITDAVTQNIAGVQAQQKTKSKKPKPEKPKRPKKVQEITYFGLVWKKNKSDNSGIDFRANDVIMKNQDGSSIKPKCCLCSKPYSPNFLYVRCERCQNWFHGDALQLEEEKINEVIQYRCCRCRRRAIPRCPYSDDYKKPEPVEFSEQTVATSSQSTMLSSEGTFSFTDQDPLLASYGIVEPIREDTMDADLSMNMASVTPGTNQKLSVRRAQVKNCEHFDQAGAPANEYYVQNQPSEKANINFSNSNELCLSEADGMDAAELLGWDFTEGNGYASPSGYTPTCQWNDTSGGGVAAEEFEPQTYFSFTELLEADDTQLDNTFGMSTAQDDGNFTGSFDEQGTSFDEMSFMIEDGSSNMHFPAVDPSDGFACQTCKHDQPPPDLKCSVCGLQVHRQCSPWDKNNQLCDSEQWSCGTCREWL